MEQTDRLAHARWHGQWIWADASTAAGPADGTSSSQVVALRSSLALDRVPAAVPARLAAVARYALWINGQEWGRGPVRANPSRQPFDVLDLAPALRAGENDILAVAWVYPDPMPWWRPPPPLSALNAGGFVLEADLGEDRWFSTDETWRAAVLDGCGTEPTPGMQARGAEHIDRRGWPTPGLDGDPVIDWSPAVLRRAFTLSGHGSPSPPTFPIGPLGARAIGPLGRVEVALADTGDGTHTAPGIVAGTIVLDVELPEGAQAVARAAEFVDDAGRPAPGDWDTTFVVVGDGGRSTTESLEIYGLRGVVVELPEGGTVHRVAVRERLHPLAGDAEFSCSDARLDQIWAAGRRTVSLCSMDGYIDCPTREQRAWVGDAVVHQLVDFATNHDWRLARWYPRLAAGSARPDGMLPMAVAGDMEAYDVTVIPDWALHWVHGVWNLYRYVGDEEEIAELLPVVERVVRWFLAFCDQGGTPADVYGNVLIDWAPVRTDGVCAALCGLWGRSLLEMAEMAEWLGDAGRAGWARRVHERLRDGFERLWDPRRDRYADALVDGATTVQASQHGQASAVVGGLVPGSRLDRVISAMTEEAHLCHAPFSPPTGPWPPGPVLDVAALHAALAEPEPSWDADGGVLRAQPFFRYVVHDALAASGHADLIASQCLDWVRMLERCGTSLSETWYGGTVSHGWSATPTRDLVTRVLGVGPAEPGFGVAMVEPSLGHLTWAKGSVPTPAGSIRVTATTTHIEVESPVPFLHGGRRRAGGTYRIENDHPTEARPK